MTTERGPLILVVDDYQDAREMYAEYCDSAGFASPRRATATRRSSRRFTLMPDLILMDLSLPGMDGWEATRRLKADERTSTFRSSR